MTIRPPDSIADVPRWLTDWGNMIAQNSAFAGQLLAQLADSLPGDVEPDYSANFPAGYNQPRTTIVTDRWAMCGAGHPDHIFACELRRGHPPETMHEAHDMSGTVLYWVNEPTASAVVDFTMPPESVTIPATEPQEGLYPLGPHCASPGPFGHVCVATAGHGGPCWAPAGAAHGRIAWQHHADGRPYQVAPV